MLNFADFCSAFVTVQNYHHSHVVLISCNWWQHGHCFLVFANDIVELQGMHNFLLNNTHNIRVSFAKSAMQAWVVVEVAFAKALQNGPTDPLLTSHSQSLIYLINTAVWNNFRLTYLVIMHDRIYISAKSFF